MKMKPSPPYCLAILISTSIIQYRNLTNGFSIDNISLFDNVHIFQTSHRLSAVTYGERKSSTGKPTRLHLSNDRSKNDSTTTNSIKCILYDVQKNPKKAIYFSSLMTISGATLGPFLDSYHSLFGVLTYDNPLIFHLVGNNADYTTVTCVTTYWVPPLFGLAAFLIGWLYVALDALFDGNVNTSQSQSTPSIPKVLIGVSFFTFQYWLSGVLYANNIDRTDLLIQMSILAALGFYRFDLTLSGFLVSSATAIGGPLIEIVLMSTLPESESYHYNDAGETGYFPLWIVPVYFLGGPANGNIARSIWNALSKDSTSLLTYSSCSICHGTRAVLCPNCDDGTYVAYDQRLTCRACRGKGRVICRSCFSYYGDDPNNIENIRRIMDEIPD